MVICVPAHDAQKALDILARFEETKKSAIIGKVSERFCEKVVLHTPWGSQRFVEPPKGELLPRIC